MTQNPGPPTTAADAIRAFLAEAAAPRERVIDDHMFTVDRAGRTRATFRLQLFTAPGTRPVAVSSKWRASVL
jgi:hypothetical protein